MSAQQSQSKILLIIGNTFKKILANTFNHRQLSLSNRLAQRKGIAPKAILKTTRSA